MLGPDIWPIPANRADPNGWQRTRDVSSSLQTKGRLVVMRWIAAFSGMIALVMLTSLHAGASEELVQIAPIRAGFAGARSSQPLLGYLMRPEGTAPRAAVVILHGCDGFGLNYVIGARAFESLGYVVLVLDSLGAANACEGGGGAAAETLDAFAALGWLAQRPFIQPDRVALLGFSMGGVAALMATERGPMPATFARHFRAVVAYYPQCRFRTGVMTNPTLILIGAADDWAPASDCEAMMQRRAGSGAPVDLRIFPGATHAFNSLAPPHVYLGHFIQFDPAASVAAREATQTFLHQWLDDPPGPLPDH
jgi:dienelactone hydrolase